MPRLKIAFEKALLAVRTTFSTPPLTADEREKINRDADTQRVLQAIRDR